MKFLIYSKHGCPYCDKIEKVLDLSNLEHEVFKLDEDFTKQQFYNKFGYGSTFPQVMLDEKNLGGCIETVKYLKENQLI